MEARIGELLQHKVGHIGTGDAQRAGRKRVGQNPVVAGERTIDEPWSADNGVIHIAGGDQTFLRRLVDERMFQHGFLRNPQARHGKRILILALLRMISRGAQHDKPVHILLAHPFENVGHGPGEDLGFFPATGPQRGKNGTVPANSVHDRSKIEDVSLDDSQMRILRQPLEWCGQKP